MRELDQEGDEAPDQEVDHAAALLGCGGVRVACAGVGGQEVPGAGDGDPALVEKCRREASLLESYIGDSD